MATITFRGVRGSCPVADPRMAGYGGSTTCVQVDAGKERVYIDAGSGMMQLDAAKERDTHHVFLTHYHWDHIMGLPYFGPLYSEGQHVTLYGERKPGVREKGIVGPIEALTQQLGAPYFPLDVTNVKARLKEHVLAPNNAVALDGMTMVAARLRHPQQSMGYVAVFGDGARAAFIWDHENGNAEIDEGLESMLKGVDVLVMDGTYTDDEYANGRKGWGHCTNTYVAALAARVGAKQLVLTHHDPRHTDHDVDMMVWEAKHVFENTIGAREGMVINMAQYARYAQFK